jgi:ATP-binding cassette subfamily G (WHITE) protein 2 (SNQ2)
MFDNVHLLMRGGKTVYAGPTGLHAKSVTEYFAERGCVCPADANPAEFILETVSPVEGTAIDWAGLWEESAQAQQMLQNIANISSRKSLLSSGDDAQAGGKASQFATGFRVQFKELLVRNARAQWRCEYLILSDIIFFS